MQETVSDEAREDHWRVRSIDKVQHTEKRDYSDFQKKSHMSFRLVPNSVTLDDLKRRNSFNRSVISPNSVVLGRIT